MESCWFLEGGRVNFLRVWFLVGPLCSSRWFHTEEYKDSTNWTQWFTLKEKKRVPKVMGARKVGMDLGEAKRKDKDEQNILYEILTI